MTTIEIPGMEGDQRFKTTERLMTIAEIRRNKAKSRTNMIGLETPQENYIPPAHPMYLPSIFPTVLLIPTTP